MLSLGQLLFGTILIVKKCYFQQCDIISCEDDKPFTISENTTLIDFNPLHTAVIVQQMLFSYVAIVLLVHLNTFARWLNKVYMHEWNTCGVFAKPLLLDYSNGLILNLYYYTLLWLYATHSIIRASMMALFQQQILYDRSLAPVNQICQTTYVCNDKIQASKNLRIW